MKSTRVLAGAAIALIVLAGSSAGARAQSAPRDGNPAPAGGATPNCSWQANGLQSLAWDPFVPASTLIDNDGEYYMATTPTSLMATLGLTGYTGVTPSNTNIRYVSNPGKNQSPPSAVTGSFGNPVIVGSARFAVGWNDESQLNEYPQAGIQATPGYPNGDVYRLDGGHATGAGMPYAAILDASTWNVIAQVPVHVAYENYTPNPMAVEATNVATPNCVTHTDSAVAGSLPINDHFALLDFNADSLYANGTLKLGVTYVAYILTESVDASGPNGDHIWYFCAANVTAAHVASLHAARAGNRLTLTWQAPRQTGVIGYNVRQSGRTLNQRLIAAHASRFYRVTVRVHGPAPVRLMAVLSSGRQVAVK